MIPNAYYCVLSPESFRAGKHESKSAREAVSLPLPLLSVSLGLLVKGYYSYT